MPLPEELRAGLDSTVADLAAQGRARRRHARPPACSCGSSSAEGIPWAHLDIAGPAFNEQGADGYTPKGGTGFGVRTLVRLAESYTR